MSLLSKAFKTCDVSEQVLNGSVLCFPIHIKVAFVRQDL
jgi:hypothetical protein